MRERQAVLVRLLSTEQRAAVESIPRRPGETLTACLRRVLLEAAGRSDLDRAVEPLEVRAAKGAAARRADAGGAGCACSQCDPTE